MATEQASLDDLPELVEDDEPEGGATEVFTTTVADKRACQHCGAAVSATFRRVCGDEDNIAHACPSCAESKAEATRFASDPGFEPGDYEVYGGGGL